MKIKVLKDILGANDQRAKENHSLLRGKNVVSMNITASPGAGKTSLITRTIDRLGDKIRFGVVEGDISSSIDAEAIGNRDIPVVQINTGGTCHLDANMVANALGSLPLDKIDFLIIENVGNLICPASFSLGEDKNVLVASIPEGHDKPHKYPVMFSQADLVVLNKIDLLPYVDFDMEEFERKVADLNSKANILQISCKTGEGLEEWFSWMTDQSTSLQQSS